MNEGSEGLAFSLEDSRHAWKPGDAGYGRVGSTSGWPWLREFDQAMLAFHNVDVVVCKSCLGPMRQRLRRRLLVWRAFRRRSL